jgi:bacteriocin biosynthesis cyclodehydratase domain-containing protein
MRNIQLCLSTKHQLIPCADGFIVSRRASIIRRITGGADLKEILTAICAELAHGQRSVGELIAALGNRYPELLLLDAIEQFSALGIIEQPKVGASALRTEGDSLSAYLEQCGDQPETYRSLLIAGKVIVIGDRSVQSAVATALAGSGIGSVDLWTDSPSDCAVPDEVAADEALVERCAGADLLVGCAQDPVDRLRRFASLNRLALTVGRPWLAVSLDANDIILGPLFVPGETACYRCLELREESRLPHPAEFQSFKEGLRAAWQPTLGDAAPPALQIAGGMAAMEVMRIIGRFSFPATYQTMMVFRLHSFGTEAHTLLRVPFCDVCGPHLTRPFRKAWTI